MEQAASEAALAGEESAPNTEADDIVARRKRAGLEGVELRFIPASGRYNNKKPWSVDLPPTSLAEKTSFEFLCGALMEENGKPRARPGVTVTFKAFDEDGRLQMEVSNSQPYKGGYYFFQHVHFECMPWTLQLTSRLTSEGPDSVPLYEHFHVITTESGRRPAPPRLSDDGEETDEDEDWKAPVSRRKGIPMRTCRQRDLASATALLKITGKKELPRLIKKRKALPKRRRWHFWEGFVAGQSRLLFSRTCLHHDLVAFMNKGHDGTAARHERRKALHRDK